MQGSRNISTNTNVLANRKKTSFGSSSSRAGKNIQSQYGRADKPDEDRGLTKAILRSIKTEHYKEDGLDQVRYFIGGQSYESFDEMLEQGLTEEDVEAIKAELWDRHNRRKLLSNVKYPTESVMKLRDLERHIRNMMESFGLFTRPEKLYSWPCFITDDCNGAVLWHCRGGGDKWSHKRKDFKRGWTKTRWVEPYFRCMDSGERLDVKHSEERIRKYTQMENTNE